MTSGDVVLAVLQAGLHDAYERGFKAGRKTRMTRQPEPPESRGMPKLPPDDGMPERPAQEDGPPPKRGSSMESIDIYSEAATLRARIETLEAALKPFAELDFRDNGRNGYVNPPVYTADIRRARELIGSQQTKDASK